nr:sodium/hydrogen exchanger 8 isoform X2 [Ipomoea trifida]
MLVTTPFRVLEEGSSGTEYNPTDAVIFVGISLVLGIACRHVLRGTRVPYTVALLILGIGLGALDYGKHSQLGKLGNGIRIWANIDPDLLLAVFLPALLFESSFSMEMHQIKLTFPYNWSWKTNLLLGGLLSATDPVAVVALLKELGASKKLSTIIEGESLMNDGVAIGLAFGVASVLWLGFIFNDTVIEITLTLAVSYVAYFTAQEVADISGVLTVMTLGMFYSAVAKTAFKGEGQQSLHHFCGVVIADGILRSDNFFKTHGMLLECSVFLDSTSERLLFSITAVNCSLLVFLAFLLWGCAFISLHAIALVLLPRRSSDNSSYINSETGILRRILNYTKHEMLNKALEAFGDLGDDEELGPADWPTVKRYITCLNDLEGERVHPHSSSENDDTLHHMNLKDIRIRFLNGVQAAYWGMLNEGRITQNTANILMQSVEEAIDLVPHVALCDWKGLRAYVNIPNYYKFLQTSIVPQKLIMFFTVERLESACYICAAFLRAHRIARQQLNDFIGECSILSSKNMTLSGTPEADFVSLAAFHLTGVAQLWHFQLEMDEPAMSWPQFKQRCYLRFGPGLRGNSLGNLTRIRQDGRSVEEYSTQFQETLTCTTSVRPDQKVDLFTAGLDEWLRIDVENMHPLNLDVAMNLARSLARKQFCFSPAVFPNPPFSSFPFAGGSRQGPTQSAPGSRLRQSPTPAASISSSAGSRSVAAPRPAVSQSRFSGGSSSGPPPERRLSRTEYQRRRAQGLCFHCDDAWSPAHNCRHLFMLVIDNSASSIPEQPFESTEPEEEHPEISLHAITGTGNGNTMRVNLRLNNSPITALIDSGSTHNFVDSTTANRLGLTIRSCPYLRVAVANGERITGLGICEDVILQKDSNYFPVNLYVIPLVGFEIVLGVHWLRTLGAILWDFTALTMSFKYNNQPVTWQGEQEPTTLPPTRQCDHHITLVTGADPVAVRPYRYPQAQKEPPVSPILDSLRRELSTSAAAQALRGKIQSGSEGPQWSLDGDFIRYKGESEIASVVINESEEEGEEARKFLEEVRVTFPQVLRVVKTRQATYAVLNQLSHYVHNLEEIGLLEEKEMIHLHDAVQTDLKKLLRNPPVVKIPKVRDLISTNPFLGALPSTERETLVGSTKEIMKLRGTTLYREGDKPTCVWLISNGVVKWTSQLTSNKQLLHPTFTHGSTLGLYEVLVGKPYICDIITDSVVLCFSVETEKLLSVLRSDPAIEDFFWQESVIVLAKVLLPQVFENMGMPDLRALVAERSTMSTYIRGESFELPHHSIGFLLEGFVRGQDAGELVTSPAALLPSRMDQSSRKSEMSGSRAGSFSHQARSYQVETRARVIMFDIGAFEADRSLRRRSSSFLLYPTEHHSRSLSREHGSLMSWPEHSSMFRGHHNLEATNQQESSLSARAMQLSIFGSKVKRRVPSFTRNNKTKPSLSRSYPNIRSNYARPLVSARSEGSCTMSKHAEAPRYKKERHSVTERPVREARGESSDESGCEDEHIVRIDSPSTLSFR